MAIVFKRLPQVDPADLMALHNNPLVRRQMPLFDGIFTEKDCQEFVAAKEEL